MGKIWKYFLSLLDQYGRGKDFWEILDNVWLLCGTSFCGILGLIVGMLTDAPIWSLILITLFALCVAPLTFLTWKISKLLTTAPVNHGITLIETPLNLKIVISQIGWKTSSTFSIKSDEVIRHPTVVEVETTLIPSSSIQIARVELEYFDKEEDSPQYSQVPLLGPPVYAEIIKIPSWIEATETFILRFEYNKFGKEKMPKNNARIRILAAGEYWYSDNFSIS